LVQSLLLLDHHHVPYVVMDHMPLRQDYRYVHNVRMVKHHHHHLLQLVPIVQLVRLVLVVHVLNVLLVNGHIGQEQQHVNHVRLEHIRRMPVHLVKMFAYHVPRLLIPVSLVHRYVLNVIQFMVV